MCEPLNRNRRAAEGASHCECCGGPIYLDPPGDPGQPLCNFCWERMEHGDPCRRCGRTYEVQFSCNWCDAPVCDGCVYAEHEDDGCRSPDDEVG